MEVSDSRFLAFDSISTRKLAVVKYGIIKHYQNLKEAWEFRYIDENIKRNKRRLYVSLQLKVRQKRDLPGHILSKNKLFMSKQYWFYHFFTNIKCYVRQIWSFFSKSQRMCFVELHLQDNLKKCFSSQENEIRSIYFELIQLIWYVICIVSTGCIEF